MYDLLKYYLQMRLLLGIPIATTAAASAVSSISNTKEQNVYMHHNLPPIYPRLKSWKCVNGIHSYLLCGLLLESEILKSFQLMNVGKSGSALRVCRL